VVVGREVGCGVGFGAGFEGVVGVLCGGMGTCGRVVPPVGGFNGTIRRVGAEGAGLLEGWVRCVSERTVGVVAIRGTTLRGVSAIAVPVTNIDPNTA
jgi:hypothetical protein